ncbi:hypothetical protein FRC02_008760 [Tulasnella sp. 418]|nr:hypothetical protein FRC02_008760 [Tulasnella sp. 418]
MDSQTAATAVEFSPDTSTDSSDSAPPIIVLASPPRQRKSSWVEWLVGLATIGWTKDGVVSQSPSEKTQSKQDQLHVWDIRAAWKKANRQPKQAKDGSSNTLGTSPIVPAEAGTFHQSLFNSASPNTPSSSSNITASNENQQRPPLTRALPTPPPPGLPPPRDRPFLRREHSRWRGNQTLRTELCMRMVEERWPGLDGVLFQAHSMPVDQWRRDLGYSIGWKRYTEVEESENGTHCLDDKSTSSHIEFAGDEDDFSSDSDGSI